MAKQIIPDGTEVIVESYSHATRVIVIESKEREDGITDYRCEASYSSHPEMTSDFWTTEFYVKTRRASNAQDILATAREASDEEQFLWAFMLAPDDVRKVVDTMVIARRLDELRDARKRTATSNAKATAVVPCAKCGEVGETFGVDSIDFVVRYNHELVTRYLCGQCVRG